MNNSKHLNAKGKSLNIGWLYPDLMSTYGDRGNIITLQKRCEWRGINTAIVNIDQNSNVNIFDNIDILFGGGAQDREQHIVINDLRKKEKLIKKLIENDVPALLVCGAPQLFGIYYEPSVGKRIEGLGIFDMTSIHPGPKKNRLVGNIIAEVSLENLNTKIQDPTLPAGRQGFKIHIVGFENHGGRTYLGTSAIPFARVIKGYGNNGEDGTEGIVYKNAIGSYLHGPLLPKNPEIADWLIKKALEVKYEEKIELIQLEDSLEKKAKETIAKRLDISF
jgi:lipid II isoglutaminyl synthase (glutamine-hydrolysing)